MRRWQIDPVRGTVMVGALSGLLAPVVFGVATLSGLASSSGAEILFQAVMQGGVGGVLPVATLMGVVRLLGAATAAILLSLAPVAALALAIPVLGDWPDPTEFLGVAIVIAGLALAHSPLARSRVAPPMGDQTGRGASRTSPKLSSPSAQCPRELDHVPLGVLDEADAALERSAIQRIGGRGDESCDTITLEARKRGIHVIDSEAEMPETNTGEVLRKARGRGQVFAIRIGFDKLEAHRADGEISKALAPQRSDTPGDLDRETQPVAVPDKHRVEVPDV